MASHGDQDLHHLDQAPENACANGALFCPLALLPQGWRSDVLLRWDGAGRLTHVTPDSARGSAALASGPVLPGMPNLHSHAFQRAMAGLAETMGSPADSFWSWRELMYRFAQRLQPRQLEAIARQTYIEMLKAGYTSVCEFHYLHHAPDGAPYADPAEMAWPLLQAAGQSGIGMTLLPVLYQQGGLGGRPVSAEQRRFVAAPSWLLGLRERLLQHMPENDMRRYGVAPHSLRAVAPTGLEELLSGLAGQPGGSDAPIHIHVAEQLREVEDCLAWSGQRPVQWLLSSQPVDARWCLVHATHMDDEEYRAVAGSGAVVGLCPTTEANLGDGVIDAPRLIDSAARWGIGSDSNIAISLRAELRLLEYAQRLHHRRRNVLAVIDAPAVADRLFCQALAGGAQAAGRAVAGLMPGQRADLVVLDPDHVNLAQRSSTQLLSALVFCEHDGPMIGDVYVGGRQVVKEGRHALDDRAREDYRHALAALLKD